MTAAPSFSPKQRLLKALNAETRVQQIAFNQIISTAQHALRDLEDKYQRRRIAIINMPDPEPGPLHLIFDSAHGADR